MPYVIRVRDYDLSVDAEVCTDQSWPDCGVSCSVDIHEVTILGAGGGTDDVKPLLDPAVIAELETEIRRRALASHAETFARW